MLRTDGRDRWARIFASLYQRRRLPMGMHDEQPIVIAGTRPDQERSIWKRRDALPLPDVHRRNRAESLRDTLHGRRKGIDLGWPRPQRDEQIAVAIDVEARGFGDGQHRLRSGRRSCPADMRRI